MQVINSSSELARLLVARQVRLVAIDGAHGSGKSTLSKALALQLGASLIEIDQYLNRHQGAYVAHLDLKAIAEQVDAEVPSILEGICMRQVVAAAGLRPDVYVYIKRMARWGWADEDDLVVEAPIEAHLERLRQQAALFLSENEHPDLGLWDEVIRYHAIHRPQDVSDFVFLRNDWESVA
jgi:shikimate kinase